MNLSLSYIPVRVAATETYTERKVDPALLTWEEFWKLVNPRDKYHPSDAYDWPASKMNGKREEYPILLFRKKIKGISFEFRKEVIDRYATSKFVKVDADKQIVRINNEVQYFTPEEVAKLGYRQYDYNFSVFDGEQQVAVTQDEWGCILVATAQEYRGFGLGPIVMKMAWEAEPGKDTGGCTPKGARVTKRVHDEFVREYLRKGIYSQLVRDKVLTPERVKAITGGIGSRYEEKQPLNFGTDNPNDWLLYANDGAFVLYDRKLKDILEKIDEENSWFWYERFIKGTSFAGGGYHDNGRLYLHQLGGDTSNIKKFMLLLALSYAKKEGVPLHVYDDDKGMLDPNYVEIDGNLATLKGNPTDWTQFSNQEARFRKSFDRYGEFYNRILELAEAKYRD
jgi:hypothetical protein